jgi:hypothetical protein
LKKRKETALRLFARRAWCIIIIFIEKKERGEGKRRRKEEKERGEGKRRRKEEKERGEGKRRRKKEEKERGEGKRRRKEEKERRRKEEKEKRGEGKKKGKKWENKGFIRIAQLDPTALPGLELVDTFEQGGQLGDWVVIGLEGCRGLCQRCRLQRQPI